MPSLTGLPIRVAGSACVLALQVLRMLPMWVSLGVGAALMPMYCLVRKRHIDRLGNLFSASPFAGRITISKYYRSRLEILIRCLHAHGAFQPEAEIRNQDFYDQALSTGRPVLLVGLHMGVVELLHKIPLRPADFIQESKGEFYIVTAPAFSQPLSEYMKRGREMGGKRVLWNRKMAGGIRNVLRKSGVMAIMADQLPGATKDILTLWGRINIPFDPSLMMALIRYGAIIIPVSTYLKQEGRSEVRFHPPWNYNLIGNTHALKHRLGGFLEGAISMAPDQWNWSYPKLFTLSDSQPAKVPSHHHS